jgi:hypothetical protein
MIVGNRIYGAAVTSNDAWQIAIGNVMIALTWWNMMYGDKV